jgi:tetratricopeptide (TPR) repeat protein
MRLYLAGKLDEACERYLDAVRMAGRYPQASEALAQAMLKKLAPARGAGASARTSPDSDRRRAQALYNEGVNHYVAGRLRKAVLVWQDALRADPTSEAIQRDLDQALRKIKRMEEQKIPIPE